ncbi:hypothetical protein POX_c04477 [Penicillium oxalicum]|uniref:hypothetical protein n=1 Tax=Penicillium oxalicum TaxID=69781 RepID=UPI0020B83EA4|nr:hypothetical protein POX_c04477 [Penicillium oxalicum]KAI2791611.1 hypothetical protein POX_c04477 [Penicillium oxalicum]
MSSPARAGSRTVGVGTQESAPEWPSGLTLKKSEELSEMDLDLNGENSASHREQL